MTTQAMSLGSMRVIHQQFGRSPRQTWAKRMHRDWMAPVQIEIADAGSIRTRAAHPMLTWIDSSGLPEDHPQAAGTSARRVEMELDLGSK
jgi:hypothetical protein